MNELCQHYGLHSFRRHLSVPANRGVRPPEAIQQFSLRVSSRGGKKEVLKDLHESVVTTLIDFMLQPLGLGQPELDCTSDELRERPTDLWRSLGGTDAERAAALDDRQNCRQSWRPTCRVAVSKALADIRQYVIHSRRLQPKPKRRKVTRQPLNEKETEYSSDDLAVEPIGKQPRADQPSTSKEKMHRMLV
ncbi:hypothetical protein Y032_0021g301 [Ancylostoma ceylanicum]|uniref:Uncharacterized protein n=1 Tax=Ancylostoma ceylanicum TaxID=53326 RepID=A0A016V040_9BILA|nr:hypothetical protein Y032_0021g301 [Ancylostoma ceylanicum]